MEGPGQEWLRGTLRLEATEAQRKLGGTCFVSRGQTDHQQALAEIRNAYFSQKACGISTWGCWENLAQST